MTRAIGLGISLPALPVGAYDRCQRPGGATKAKANKSRREIESFLEKGA